MGGGLDCPTRPFHSSAQAVLLLVVQVEREAAAEVWDEAPIHCSLVLAVNSPLWVRSRVSVLCLRPARGESANEGPVFSSSQKPSSRQGAADPKEPRLAARGRDGSLERSELSHSSRRVPSDRHLNDLQFFRPRPQSSTAGVPTERLRPSLTDLPIRSPSEV